MLGEEPLGVMEVAQMLHVGRNKVYELARSGELSSYHIGRKLRFTVRDVQRYLDAQHSGIALDVSTHVVQAHASADDSGVAYLANLASGQASFTIAGSDVVAALLASSLSDGGLPTAQRLMSGFAALIALYLGEADAAVVDLYDAKTNSFNVPFVQRLAPGAAVVVVSLCERTWGFAVAPGNSKKITTWGSVLHEGVRIAQQPHGTGGRVLLDEKLMGMEARAQAIAGYGDAPTGEHAAVMRVLSGECDMAVCAETTAAQVGGVSFVPMQKGRLDLVLRKSPSNRAFVRVAKEIVASDPFRAEVEAVSHGDCSKSGAVVFEC